MGYNQAISTTFYGACSIRKRTGSHCRGWKTAKGGVRPIIDLNPDILQALESSGEVISRVGFDKYGNARIYQRNIPHPDLYPQITFFEITNFDSNYADDEPIESTVAYQVSIWTKASDPALNTEVDKAMKSLGFLRNSSMDAYESDVDVYHKGLRYRMAVSAE